MAQLLDMLHNNLYVVCLDEENNYFGSMLSFFSLLNLNII